MAQAFHATCWPSRPANQRSFTEKIGAMVDRLLDRSEQPPTRAPAAPPRAPHHQGRPLLENVWCEPQRGLDKAVMRDLGATCQWIRKKHNVIVVGKMPASGSRISARRWRRRLAPGSPRPLHPRAAPRASSSRSRELTVPTPRCSPAKARQARCPRPRRFWADRPPLKDTERRDLKLEVAGGSPTAVYVDGRDLTESRRKTGTR